jgi:hypothetical protein
MTPQACASTITARFNRAVRNADVGGFYAFVDSDEFVRFLAGAGPKYRRGILGAYAAAREAVERRARVVRARPMGQGRVRWTPGMLAQLASAYSKGLSDEAVGRQLGISADAARLRRKRAHAH